MNGNMTMISFSVCLLVVYRKAIDFRKFILYPATLSQSYQRQVSTFYFYMYDYFHFHNKDNHTVFVFMCLNCFTQKNAFQFRACCHKWLGFLLLCEE